MEEPGFWNDSNDAQEKMKELKSLESVVEGFKKLETRFEDIETLIEMGYEEEDESLIEEINEEMNTFVSDFVSLRLSTSYRVSMIQIMRYLRFMPEPAVQKAVTGRVCFAVCIRDGLIKKALKLKCLILLTGMKPE